MVVFRGWLAGDGLDVCVVGRVHVVEEHVHDDHDGGVVGKFRDVARVEALQKEFESGLSVVLLIT